MILMFRLFYAKGLAKSQGCEAMISKWETLRVKVAGALVQEIIVPEFGIRKVQSQPTYLVDDEEPTIYLTSNSELTGRAITTHMVSYQLAELFKVPSLRSDIA